MSEDNIRYSPSIKRRPGKFYGRKNIPPSLSPTKAHSPAKLSQSPQKKPSSHKVRTPIAKLTANDVPAGERKITDFFTKSANKDANAKGISKQKSLSLKRSVKTTEAKNISRPGVSPTPATVPSGPIIDLTELYNEFEDEFLPTVNSSSEAVSVDHAGSDASDVQEILSGIDWKEIDRIEKTPLKGEPLSRDSVPHTMPEPDSQGNISGYQRTSVRTKLNFSDENRSVEKFENPVLTPTQVFHLTPMISGSFIHFLISTSGPVILQKVVFTEEDFNIANSFMTLSKIEQDLYSKLFLRVNAWIRLSRVEYNFVMDLESSLGQLERSGFITSKFHTEDLRVLLDLLQLNEVKEVCKEFCKHSKGNKSNMIEDLLKLVSTQKTLWSQNSKSYIAEKIKLSAQKLLKCCIKLTATPREFFLKLALTSSYAHFIGDERERLKTLVSTFYNLKGQKITFPVYPVSSDTVVFHCKEQFDNYYKALSFKMKVLNEEENKNWVQATELIKLAKEEFIHFLNNEHLMKILDALPDFLRRFTGGYVYSGIISKGIVVIKKNKSNNPLVIECLHLLLSQHIFHRRRRGDWYTELALLYQNHLKDLLQAHEVLINGLRDELVNDISKRALSHKARKLLERKNSGLNEFQKITLRSTCVSVHFKPSTTFIEAKAALKGCSGMKQVFIMEQGDEKQYSSVEDIVIDYYKFHEINRYSKAIHDEGKLILNLALACFWDEIYCEPTGINVFHSPLQTAPLDWCTTGFYERRKHLIKKKVDLIKGPDGIIRVMEIIQSVFDGNKAVQSVVNWDILSLESLSQNLEKIKEFLECLKPDVFANIADHLLKNYRLYRSGFPDLTLWDPATKKCFIVEVKGPSDTLSHSQSFWLENLHTFGAHAEVCKVENLHSHQSKRKNHVLQSEEHS